MADQTTGSAGTQGGNDGSAPNTGMAGGLHETADTARELAHTLERSATALDSASRTAESVTRKVEAVTEKASSMRESAMKTVRENPMAAVAAAVVVGMVAGRMGD